MVIARKATVDEILGNDNFELLRQEYAIEAAIAGLPAPTDKVEQYRALQNTGMFQAFGAFAGNTLAGFVAVLTPVLPHYNVAISVVESLFVGKSYRRQGCPGLKLIRAAEKHAREIGSPGILFSAPTNGMLHHVLAGMMYRETNRVFFKAFRNA